MARQADNVTNCFSMRKRSLADIQRRNLLPSATLKTFPRNRQLLDIAPLNNDHKWSCGMHPIINATARTALCFLAFCSSGPRFLGAAPAWAEADAGPAVSRPVCEEGHALLAGRLGYLEARVSPAADQQQAWQTFKAAVRAAMEPLDSLCLDNVAPGASPDPANRLEGMEKFASAMQKMFAGLQAAVAGLGPVLTSAQRDILARHILPPPPPGMPPFPPPPIGMPPFGRAFGPEPPSFAMTAVPCGIEPLGLPF
jgi:hypothetical protein